MESNLLTGDNTGNHQAGIVCNPARSPASMYGIEGGIDHLRQLDGRMYNVAAGPATCARVACDTSNAIFICQGKPVTLSIDCDLMVNYTVDIIAVCGTTQPFRVLGQEFLKFDNRNIYYNTIVKGDTC